MVILGSSFISMELVVAMSKRKLASIDVIGMEEFPFEGVLGKAIGAGLKKVLFSFCHQLFICCSNTISTMNRTESNSIC